MVSYNKIWRFLSNNRYRLKDVFTPSTAATINYIKRPEIEKQINNALDLQGTQIILFGHSGGGKTTILKNVLWERKQHVVTTHCQSNSKFDSLIRNAFDELDPYYVSQKSYSRSDTRSFSSSSEYNNIKMSLNFGNTQTDSTALQRLLPPQLTIQKLAYLLGGAECLWIIEDFHKLPANEKKNLADSLKAFVDLGIQYPKLKIICIGAASTAHELIELDSNLSNRVSQIHVPLLSDDEITCFIKNGCGMLNCNMSTDLIEKIVYYSNRLASIAHKMCYVMCSDKNIYYETFNKQTKISDDRFSAAVEDYISSNSDTLKTMYYEATKSPLGWYLLKTFASSGNDYYSIEELLNRVSTRSHFYTYEEVEVELNELCSMVNPIVFYIPKYDKYTLSSPFILAFLKMQLELEKFKRNKAKQNRQNRKLQFWDNKDKDSMVYSAVYKFMEENGLLPK